SLILTPFQICRRNGGYARPNIHWNAIEDWSPSQASQELRYTDGPQELYDHRMDPNEFTNLAQNAKFNWIKQSLAAHIPATDASFDSKLAGRQQKKHPLKDSQ
ncbi:MAG: hypothetical protein ACKVHE_28270, partial [Planctomycetales bacterium]